MSDSDERSTGPDDCSFTLSNEQAEALSKRSVDEEVEIFSTLGSETRYRILLILDTAENPVCVCELEPYLEVGQSSISQSLSRLRKDGLVSRTKEGRWRYYEPTPLAERLIQTVRDRPGADAPVPGF